MNCCWFGGWQDQALLKKIDENGDRVLPELGSQITHVEYDVK
jgi:hypothetical protein